MRSNVLWLVFDTARRDAFEPYGAAPGASPAVADLARRGRALNGVHATGSWTIPSHASMFTGLLPSAAGLLDAPQGKPRGCKPAVEAHRDRLLPEVMRRNGYATAGLTTNLWLEDTSGFATGFDDWVSVRTYRQDAIRADTLRARLAWASEALRAQVDDGAAEAGRVMRGWAESGPRRPFFWFANLIECHSPYLPPKPWNDLGALDRVRAATEARRHLTMSEIWKACAGGFDVPDEALERMRHLYGRAIRSLDDWLADLLAALDRGGLLDDTLVILSADHGENFGEGGLMGHSLSLDERLLHVPFVVSGPGADAFDGMCSLVELPRRIAAAVGLEEHPWREDLPEGVAVAQLHAVVPPGDPKIDIALAEWGLPAEAAAAFTTPLSCATDGTLKLVRRGADEELYDLAADPLELEPLAAVTANGAVDRLRAALDHPAAVAVAEPPPESGAAADEANAEEIEDLEARMRQLGYL